MSVIRGLLTDRIDFYTLDTSTKTAGRQPIEILVGPAYTNQPAKFKPKTTLLHYLTGQVLVTDDIMVTERALELNHVLLFGGVYYRIVKVQTLKGPGARGRKVIGYAGKTEIWRH